MQWTIPLKKYNGGDKCLKQTVCGHARQVMYLSPEGRMLPCMSLSSYDIQEEYPLVTEECGACEYAKICAGGCRASALCYDKTDIMAPDRAACLIFCEGYGKRLEEVLKGLHMDGEGVL